MQYNNENEWTVTTYNRVDESPKDSIVQKKLNTKEQTEYYSIHIKLKTGQTIVSEVRIEGEWAMIGRGKRGFSKCWPSTFSWFKWWLHACALFMKIHQGVSTHDLYTFPYVCCISVTSLLNLKSNWKMWTIVEK